MEPWLQVVLTIFGGGGVATVAVEALRWWRERELTAAKKDVQEATAAEVLTSTATGLLAKMQDRIDHLEEELADTRRDLARAQEHVHILEAKLEERASYDGQIGVLQERLRVAENESERLRAQLPHRNDDENRES